MSGRLEAIWVKRAKGGPMDGTDSATLVEGRGIEGNANQGGWRQVTVISQEVFDRLQEDFGPEAAPEARRANFLVSGVDLRESRDHTLHIGPVAIQLRGETRPCEQMDDACTGLREALKRDWGGGAFGAVIQGGTVTVGDEVSLTPPSEDG